MRASSPLKEIRGLKSLRRDRSGTAYSSTYYNGRIPTYHSRNPRGSSNGVPHRRTSRSPTVSSSSSSGTNSKESSSRRIRKFNPTQFPKNENLVLQNLKLHDEANNEGLESMHHSLARSIISKASQSTAASSRKSDNYPFRNPLFKMRYSRLVQDEETSLDHDDHEYYHEGIFGILVAKHILRKLMKCLAILFITVCFTSILAMEGDLYKFSNRKIPQHDDKYQSQMGMYDGTNVTLYHVINNRVRLLDSFSNLTEPFDKKQEIPFFLDVKLTGSEVVKRSISKCMQLSMACELGLRQPDFKEDELQVFSSLFQGYNGLYVNVDVSTKSGIERAKKLNLTQSHLADVISMNMLYEGNKLFKPETDNALVESYNGDSVKAKDEDSGLKKGRIFTIFSHPISRAIAHYHYMKEATWDSDYNEKLKDMSLLEYASSKYVEDNPMTKTLTNIIRHRKEDSVSSDYQYESSDIDLEVAKKILESKILIGLYRDLDGSIARFQRYFSWVPNERIPKEDILSSEDIQTCKDELIQTGDKWLAMKITEDDEVWKQLAESLQYDVELYKHAELLYDVQGEKIFEVVN